MSEARTIRIERSAGGTLAGRFEAMASPCELLVDGADERELRHWTEVAAAEVWRIEAHWSRYRQGNIVDQINRAEGQAIEVDEETARFLDYAQQLHALSEGLFDVTSGVLRRVWRFDGSDRLPSAEAVAALLPLVGWSKVDWHSPRLRMAPGMEIDFGGIGKEYAVDRACALLAAAGAPPALLNCGGDLAATAPRRDGEAWRVGIDLGGIAAASLIQLRQGAITTSGDAHRFLLRDGIRYPHVLDPRSGWPVTGGPRAVTVAAGTCTEAGVLSTLAMLHGPRAQTFLDQYEAEAQLFW